MESLLQLSWASTSVERFDARGLLRLLLTSGQHNSEDKNGDPPAAVRLEIEATAVLG